MYQEENPIDCIENYWLEEQLYKIRDWVARASKVTLLHKRIGERSNHFSIQYGCQFINILILKLV